MTNLYQASNQWAERPDDERFSTIEEMLAACKSYADAARTTSVLTGWAWVGEPILQINLPGPAWAKKKGGFSKADLKELAQTFEHEIDHTKGLLHEDMPEWWDLRPKWHKGFEIRFQKEQMIGIRAAKRKLASAEKRYAAAKKARDEWRRKVRALRRSKNG